MRLSVNAFSSIRWFLILATKKEELIGHTHENREKNLVLKVEAERDGEGPLGCNGNVHPSHGAKKKKKTLFLLRLL